MELEEVVATYASLADLDRLLIGSKRGRPIAIFSWSFVLFFPDGEALDKRLLANRVLSDFLNVFGSHVTHYHPADSTRLKRVGDLDVRSYFDQVAREASARSGKNENDSYGADVYGFDGGKDVDAPAPYNFSVVASSRLRRQSSFIRANVPLTWPASNDLSSVAELFVRWCSLLGPAHGTASPGVVLTQGSLPGSDFVEVYPLIQRLPGLDYTDAPRWTSESRQSARTIRTIGWLTALDSEFLEQLGGFNHIRRELPAEILLHPYSGGAVIQAGSEPEFGDRNRGVVPPSLRAIAELADPLIFRAYPRGVFNTIPLQLNAAQETAKWVNRFQIKD